MRRAAALVALALGASGCVLSLGSLSLLGGPRPLTEETVDG